MEPHHQRLLVKVTGKNELPASFLENKQRHLQTETPGLGNSEAGLSDSCHGHAGAELSLVGRTRPTSGSRSRLLGGEVPSWCGAQLPWRSSILSFPPGPPSVCLDRQLML